MRQMTRQMWMVLGIPSLLAGCAMDEAEVAKLDEPLVLTAATQVSDEGRMALDTVVFAENPTTLLEQGDFHGYNFRGKAGGVVTITMSGAACGGPDTFLNLFRPADASGDRGVDIAHNDDAFEGECGLDSRISGFTLPVDGDYLIVATSFLQRGGGHYRLELRCDSGECAQAGQTTFESSRIAQADIDAGKLTPAQLFSNGFFLFKKIYRLEEGLGNALAGAPAGNNPAPNFRAVHQGGFGAPEAQSCATCHNGGGVDGAGDLNHNIFQIGNGVDPATGLQRNSPSILGLGFRQLIGIEMTNELKAQQAAARAAAQAQGKPVTAQLSAKGTSFGSLVARPDGSVDTANVQGVDPDLVVRPFGWKGREALLRRFIEGGFRVHFGMQTAPSVAKHCAAPDPATFGTGADCKDPDGDGFADEITEGQLSSISIYLGLRQVPVRVPPADPAARARATAGEALFAQVGCASCHTGSMRMAGTTVVEPADTTGGPGIALNLAADTREPRPARNADGSMSVELWSDFKRHDMGADLADSKPFKNIAPSHFITTPLWGVATSAPYLHDGRAPTLHDAIALHGGEGTASRNAYLALPAAQQQEVVAFLATLSRSENLAPPAPPTVDLGGFVLSQSSSTLAFTLPPGTIVPKGGYVIVGRDATREEFQAFWGVTLGANVVYINSTSQFPSINGAEKFAIKNATGAIIDGPTVAQPSGAGKTFQRVSGAAAPESASSWVVKSVSTRTSATPGSGQSSTGANRVYISEFSDATGTGSFVFEFVEVFVE